jgi:hypothetical protein
VAQPVAGLAGVAAPVDQRGYAAHVRGYLVPHLGGIPLAALTPGDVQAMFTAIIRDETAGRPSPSEGSSEPVCRAPITCGLTLTPR